jgi:hypothetical protein
MIGLAEEVVQGAVDVYVHASPDLLPRRTDDLGLATECAASGYAGAVHRHHFSTTVERAILASAATGFDLRGAVLLNDSVGGLNPFAVELALRLGGRWIGLPTLSADFHRAHLPVVSDAMRGALLFGPGRLVATDPEGALLDEVHEILRLGAALGAVVNLGYVSPAECEALVAAAPADSRLVATNPHTSMHQPLPQIVELARRGVTVELTAYSMHPDGPNRRAPQDAVDAAANLIRTVGVDSCVLSSDGGMTGAPSPPELLAWLLNELAIREFTSRDLIRLTHDNPSRLVAR